MLNQLLLQAPQPYIMATTKACNNCNLSKNIESDFGKNRAECKKCMREKIKANEAIYEAEIANTTKTRRCNTCDEAKLLTEFAGTRSMCKACKKATNCKYNF